MNQKSSELDLINRFCEDAMLNNKGSTWLIKRKFGADYGCFLIASNGGIPGAWYEPYIGVKFIGQIIYRYNRNNEKTIDYVYPVRLMNTSMHHGKSICAKALILI